MFQQHLLPAHSSFLEPNFVTSNLIKSGGQFLSDRISARSHVEVGTRRGQKIYNRESYMRRDWDNVVNQQCSLVCPSTSACCKRAIGLQTQLMRYGSLSLKVPMLIASGCYSSHLFTLGFHRNIFYLCHSCNSGVWKALTLKMVWKTSRVDHSKVQ